MKGHKIPFVIFGIIIFFLWREPSLAGSAWKTVASGVEYGLFTMRTEYDPAEVKVHMLRIDPAQITLKLLLASELSVQPRTTSEWCQDFNLLAAINAGMFQKDYLTHVGYLRNGPFVHNRAWNKYKSALAFNPRRVGLPAATVVDLDTPGARERLDDYHSVVQNLRLMKGGGINVWSRSDKKWREAALGTDSAGRIFFILVPTPLTMWDFVEGIKSLGIGINQLMHLEGGSLASLYIRDINLNLEEGNESAPPSALSRGRWPIPNVLGIQWK